MENPAWADGWCGVGTRRGIGPGGAALETRGRGSEGARGRDARRVNDEAGPEARFDEGMLSCAYQARPAGQPPRVFGRVQARVTVPSAALAIVKVFVVFDVTVSE